MASTAGTPPPASTGRVAPEPDVSITGRFLAATIPPLGIALIVVVSHLTIGVRLNVVFVNVSILSALVFAMLYLGLLYAAIPHGFGRHNFYLSIDDRIEGGRLIQLSYFPWVWGVALGKIGSAAVFLSIFKTTLPWVRGFLWVVIAVQGFCALAFTIIMLVQCRPIEASWDPRVPRASCWELNIFHASLYSLGAITVATDFIFAALPSKLLIPTLLGPARKITIIIILSCGVLFSSFTIVKLTYVNRLQFCETGDQLFKTVDVAIWSVAEMLSGIITTCIPGIFTKVNSLLYPSTPGVGSGNSLGHINIDDPGAEFGSSLINLPSKQSDIETAGTPSER